MGRRDGLLDGLMSSCNGNEVLWFTAKIFDALETIKAIRGARPIRKDRINFRHVCYKWDTPTTIDLLRLIGYTVEGPLLFEWDSGEDGSEAYCYYSVILYRKDIRCKLPMVV